jgi:hypothetical protein
MKKDKEIGLDFIVDKLTNSIENIVTGDTFATDISLLTQSDLKLVTKAKGWLFSADMKGMCLFCLKHNSLSIMK